MRMRVPSPGPRLAGAGADIGMKLAYLVLAQLVVLRHAPVHPALADVLTKRV